MEEALKVTARSVRNLGVSMGRNTVALEQNSRDLRDGISGLVSSLLGGGLPKRGGGILSSLTGGFGLASVGLRIAGLFGSRKKEPEPLLPFELPPSIALEESEQRQHPGETSTRGPRQSQRSEGGGAGFGLGNSAGGGECQRDGFSVVS